MGVTVCSIFRDSSAYVDRYFRQIDRLEDALSANVRLCIAEGDSTDDTHSALYRHIHDRGKGDTLLKVDHGGPKYGSVDLPERWAQIATVCNAVIANAEPTGPLIYVESDLLHEPEIMLTLLEDLTIVPAVAPLSMSDGRFYDVWGHRGLDGQRFQMQAPYHPDLVTDQHLVEIGSAGSCVVMRKEVAEVARFGDNDCIVGLGRDIRNRAKASLWLDRRVAVRHP